MGTKKPSVDRSDIWRCKAGLKYVIATAVIDFGLNPASGQASALLRTGAARGVAEPSVEVGVLVGRDGAAFGPGVLLQGNLGFVGRADSCG